MADPVTKRIELLFTGCRNGYSDLPFPTEGAAVRSLKGKKVGELPWLQRELEDCKEGDLNEWTLAALQLEEFDGDDEIPAWVTLKAPSNYGPMMNNYLELKGKLPDGAMLLFRLGDFYEVFFEDAKRLADAMGLVVTKRREVPMCGFPVHMLADAFRKLREAGIAFAIADQPDPNKPERVIRPSV